MGRNEGGGEPRIGDKAKAVFLRALGRGAGHEEAARAAGFSRSAFLLEHELCAFTYAGCQAPESPDRADATIWAMSELIGPDRTPRVRQL